MRIAKILTQEKVGPAIIWPETAGARKNTVDTSPPL